MLPPRQATQRRASSLGSQARARREAPATGKIAARPRVQTGAAAYERKPSLHDSSAFSAWDRAGRSFWVRRIVAARRAHRRCWITQELGRPAPSLTRGAVNGGSLRQPSVPSRSRRRGGSSRCPLITATFRMITRRHAAAFTETSRGGCAGCRAPSRSRRCWRRPGGRAQQPPGPAPARSRASLRWPLARPRTRRRCWRRSTRC